MALRDLGETAGSEEVSVVQPLICSAPGTVLVTEGLHWVASGGPRNGKAGDLGEPKMQLMLMPCLTALAAVCVYSLRLGSLKHKGIFYQGSQLCECCASLERNPGGRGAAEMWLEPLVCRTWVAEEGGLCFGGL